MGLTPGTLVAETPRGILDPATGKPVGSNDPYFMGQMTNCRTRVFWSLRPKIWCNGRALAR